MIDPEADAYDDAPKPPTLNARERWHLRRLKHLAEWLDRRIAYRAERGEPTDYEREQGDALRWCIDLIEHLEE